MFYVYKMKFKFQLLLDLSDLLGLTRSVFIKPYLGRSKFRVVICFGKILQAPLDLEE